MTRTGWAILAGWLSMCAQAAAQAPAASVRVDAARIEQVANWREVTGRIRPSRRSQLATQEAGQVVSILFEEGDRVEAGQVLVKLDDARAQFELERAQAVHASHQALIDARNADLADAQRNLRLVQESFQSGSATNMEVDDEKTQVARAEAMLAEAKADLSSAAADVSLAQRRLDDLSIEAPFSGFVVRQDTEVGQWLGEGESVLEILDLDQIEVWLDVPERYLGQLTGDNAGVRVRVDAAGLEMESSLTGLVPDVDPLSRLAPVWVRVENRDGMIKPGMSVVGLVPTGQMATRMTIHKDAILRDDAGEFVYFNAGGTAAPSRVDRLFAVGDRVAIRDGALPPGAELVVEGNERLFPGQPLNIVHGGEDSSGKGSG